LTRRSAQAAQAAGATMFLLDPCGNALEFKAFADPTRLFAK
jgi:extradiol dioxygenase family protein